VLLRDGRAIGKLLRPAVTSVRLGVAEGGDDGEEGAQVVLSQCSLTFEAWCPARGTRAAGARQAGGDAPQPLRLPVDDAFERSTFRVSVIGRQGGSAFAVPAGFEASGKELASAVSVEQQRLEYIRGHQARRGGAEQGAPGSEEGRKAAPSATVTVGSGARGCCACLRRCARRLMRMPAWVHGAPAAGC
jgi:hypothetical protein